MDSDITQKTFDKANVKKVLKSLQNINREILKANGIEDQVVDDFIYLTIRMEQPIRPQEKLGENFKNIKTPV